MIDDRRKPSAPPPPGEVTEDEEPVEILAGEAAASVTRRRPSRRLRVPNDPVPRRASQPRIADDDEARTDGRRTDPNIGVVQPSIPPPPPDASVLNDAITVPSVDPDALGLSTEPTVVVDTTLAVRAPSTTPPADDGATAAPLVTRKSAPPASDGSTRPASNRPAARVSTRPASLTPLARSSIVPPPAAVPGAMPESKTAPTDSRPASSSESSGDAVNMVRQVRRKIRSVGTGSAPSAPTTRESSTPAAETPSAPAPQPPESDPTPISIPVPLVAGMMGGEDDFVVPPVDAAAVNVPPAPAVPSIELRPALPPRTEEDASARGEEPESVEVSIDEEAAEAHAHDVEGEHDPEAQAHLREATDDEDDSGPSLESIGDEEVVEEATDDDAAARANPPPAPPRSAAADASGKPPPPPAATPAATAPGREAGKEPRKKRRAWWEELFNDDYFRTMPRHSPQQIALEGDFIEASLGVEKGAAVLDVACGAGRQAIEMATRGYEVIALDLSLPMLSRAADAAQESGAKLNFLHSDMREMEFTEMFDAAYCMNTSFGFFDDEKNADVARRLHRALKNGGTLLLDVLNRDYAINGQPAMVWYEGDGCVCMEETTFNYFTSRLVVKRTMIFDDGRQREIEYSIRLYSLHELGRLLHDVGFKVVEVSGHASSPGAFFGPASRNLIILAQKSTSVVPATPATTTATATPAVTATGGASTAQGGAANGSSNGSNGAAG